MKRFSIYDGARILFDQREGGLVADDRGGSIAASTENRRTFVGTMRVGGQKIHAVVAEERFGGVLRCRSEFARDAHGRHLDQHTALDILSHDRWPVLDLPIALGVNEDRMWGLIDKTGRIIWGPMKGW